MSNLNTINDDKFLFACLEHEKTCDALSRAVYSERFKSDSDDLDTNLKSLVQHYQTKLSTLADKENLVIDDLPELVPPVVGFSNDLMDIFDKADETLQPYVASESSSDPHWSLIESLIQNHLGKIGKHFLNYLRWYFGQQQTTNSSPQQSNSYNNRSGGESYQRRGKPDHRRPRDNGRRNQQGGGGGPRHRGKPKFTEESRMALEEKTKVEVQAAVDKLKNSDERELSLKPANSYHRRLQHQIISDSGLYSYSVGEGRERFVVITKNENMSSAE